MKVQTVDDLAAFLGLHAEALGEIPRVHIGCSLQAGKPWVQTGQNACLTLQGKRQNGVDLLHIRAYTYGKPGTSVKKPCRFDFMLSFCSGRTGATVEYVKRDVTQADLLTDLFGAVETLFDPI